MGECLRGCFLGFCVYIVRWAGWQVFVLQAIVGCCAAQVLVGEKQLSKKSRLLLLPVIALIVFDPPLLD